MEHNVFDLTAKPLYKLRPFARIKWWFRRAKFVRQRARWGFSEYDAWDLDTYLATVISGALKFLSEHNTSHPWEVTDEEWKEKIKTTSECFSQYNEEPDCPSYRAYHEAVERIENEDGSISINAPEELLRAWHDEEKRNYENKMKKLKEGFDLLYEIYPYLWD